MERRVFDVNIEGAVLHCQEPTYWDIVKHTLTKIDNSDFEMLMRALHVRALSYEEKPDQTVPLSFDQARLVLKRFNSYQLNLFDLTYIPETRVLRTPVKFKIPEPQTIPHWINPNSRNESKIFKGSKRWYDSKEEAIQDLRKRFDDIKKMVQTSSKEEKLNEVEEEAERLLGRELEAGEEVEVSLSTEEKTDRFKLYDVIDPLYELISTGLFVVHGTIGNIPTGIRYVCPKELHAIGVMTPNIVVRVS